MTHQTILRTAVLLSVISTLAACGGSSGDASSSAAPNAAPTGTATTNDASVAAVVAFTSATYAPAAPAATASVAVNRIGSATGGVSASYATVNGTAIAGTDYTPTSGTLTWADGDTSTKTIAVPVASTAGGKVFGLSLTGVSGASLGSPSSTSVQVAGSSSASSTVAATATTPSANGTEVGASGQIIDQSLNHWSISSGAAMMGAAPAGYSANVVALMYYNGTVYQENNACMWWSWNGSTWVAAANPQPSVATTGCSPASASATTPAAAPAPAAAVAAGSPSVHAQGNLLVDANGNPVQLRGGNLSSLEGLFTSSSGSYDYFQGAHLGTYPFFGAMQAWKMNTIRLPLNEATWLHLSGQDIMNLGPTVQTDPANNYQATVKKFVADANAAGLYVILDLHWTAPGNYLASTQDQLPDTDHSIAFWTSLAQTFGNNPGVIFDLFNEPYPGPTGSQNAYQVLLNGSTQTVISYNSGNSKINLTWTSAGMQQLVDTVRSAGATNLVMIGGAVGATDLSGFTTAGGGYFPKDPLHNAAASWHAYGVNGPSFTTTNAAFSANVNAVDVANQILSQGIPIVIGEVGDGSSNGTASAPVMSYTQSWADAHGQSLVAWAWDNWSPTGGSSNLLIKDSSGTPTDGEGVAFKAWLGQH